MSALRTLARTGQPIGRNRRRGVIRRLINFLGSTFGQRAGSRYSPGCSGKVGEPQAFNSGRGIYLSKSWRAKP